MSVAADQEFATISLEVACDHKSCADFAFPLYQQLDGGDYSWPMSVVDMNGEWKEYYERHGTARKRFERAHKLGYYVREFDRIDEVDHIHSINTSLPERQGRPMSASYLAPPVYSELDQPCPRHRVNCYGVFEKETEILRAYSFIYRSGQLALVSQILGHGDHLEKGIMFLLVVGLANFEWLQGGYLTYNRHDSGTSGLQWHKERLGFRPTKVEWTT